MNADDFRRLALELPEATEEAHMGHPDFRVRNKIFATLGPKGDWAMVKLTPEQQAEAVRSEPDVFERIPGGWGRGGATKISLGAAREPTLRRALITAWRNTAPKKLVRDSGLE